MYLLCKLFGFHLQVFYSTCIMSSLPSVCVQVCMPFSLELFSTFSISSSFKNLLSFATGVHSYLVSVVVLKHG